MSKRNNKAMLIAGGVALAGVYLMYPSDSGGGYGGGLGGILPTLGGAADGAAGGAADGAAAGAAGGFDWSKWFGDDAATKKTDTAAAVRAIKTTPEGTGLFSTIADLFGTPGGRQTLRVVTGGEETKKMSCHAEGDYQSYAASIFGGSGRTARSTKQDMFRMMRETNKRVASKKTSSEGGYSTVSGGGRAGWQQMGYRKPTRPGQPDRY